MGCWSHTNTPRFVFNHSTEILAQVLLSAWHFRALQKMQAEVPIPGCCISANPHFHQESHTDLHPGPGRLHFFQAFMNLNFQSALWVWFSSVSLPTPHSLLVHSSRKRPPTPSLKQKEAFMDKSTASTLVRRDKQAQPCSIISRAGVIGGEGEKREFII